MSHPDDIRASLTPAQRTAPTPLTSDPVVAIAVDASGLDDLREFLEAMPPDHQLRALVTPDSPDTRRAIETLVHSALGAPLDVLTDPTQLAPGRILLTPDNAQAAIEGGVLRWRRIAIDEWASPIDAVFEMLALECGDAAIGVMLGRTGADGLRAIANAGGLTIVSERAAEVEGEPGDHVIAAGFADFTISPSAMPAEILDFVRHLAEESRPRSAQERQDEITPRLPAITSILARRVNHDFRHYRSTTLARRILRRMHVRRMRHVDDYISLLERSEEECTALFRELIIGVTAFFRDPLAFESLERHVIPELLERRRNEDVRIWVPGCASGKEAYSLAILFHEHVERLGATCNVQIIASDIDERALAFARRGVYPQSDAEAIGKARLQKYFVRRGGRLHVRRELREKILFCVHNVTSDPPFTKLDLISCRNLLIYFGPQLQRRLLPMFHASLRTGGYLFLGPSENIDAHAELFKPIDSRHRISQKRCVGPESRREVHPVGSHWRLPGEQSVGDEADIGRLSAEMVLNEFSPPFAVVTDDKRVVHLSAGAEKYLQPPEGAFDNNIIRMTRDSVRTCLRAALTEAISRKGRASRQSLSPGPSGRSQPVTIVASPLRAADGESELYLIVFDERSEKLMRPEGERADASDTERIIAQLESDLATTRTDLESTVQELESANEELKSSNEEFLSMNEELQSANEELVAGAAALSRANEEIENLLASTRLATIFLDRESRIRSFTPAASEIYNLIDSDIGRPIAHITHRALLMPPLPDVKALDTASPVDELVEVQRGDVYRRRVLPYRKSDGTIDGLVVTFTDITELKRSEAALRHIADALPAQIMECSREERFVFCNSELANRFERRADDIVGRTVQEVFGAESYAKLRSMIQRALRGAPVTVEHRMAGAGGAPRDFVIELIPKVNDAHEVVGFISLMHDITSRKQRERELAAKHAVDRTLIQSHSLEDASHDLMKAVCNAFHADVAHLWIPDSRDGWLMLMAEYRRSAPLEEFTRKCRSLRIARGQALPGRAWQDGRSFLMRDLTTDHGFGREALCKEFDLQSGIAFPIMAGDECFGVIEFFTHEPLALDRTMLDVCDSIGRGIGQAIVRYRAEEALRESEMRFRVMADAAPALIWIADINKMCTWFNRRWLQFTGRTLEEECGRGWLECVHPEDRERCAAAFDNGFDRREPFQVDYRLRRADGEYRWVSDEGVPLYSADGVFKGYIGACADIHRRRDEEEKANFFAEVTAELASGRGHRAALERIAQLTVPRFADWCIFDLLDESGRFERVAVAHRDPARADRVRDELRRRPLQVSDSHNVARVARTRTPMLVPNLTEAAPRFGIDEDYRKTLQSYDVKSMVCAPLMAQHEVLGTFTLMTAESGRRYNERDLEFVTDLGRRIGVAIENVRLQEEILQSEERLSMALEAGRMGAWEWEEKTGTVKWSPSLEDIHGLTPEKFEGTFEQFERCIHPEDREHVLSALESAYRSGAPYHVEYRIIRPDGAEVWVESRGRVVLDDHGVPTGMTGVCADVTDRKRVEAILKDQLHALAIVYRLSSELAMARNESQALKSAVRAASDVSSADKAAVLLLDEDGVMRFRTWDNLSDAYRASAEGHNPWRADDPSPQPVQIEDVLADESLAPLHENFRREMIRAIAFVPILHEGRLLGKFMLYSPEPSVFPQDQIRLVQTIANHLALAIERRRAESSLIESNRRLETLAAVSSELLSMSEPREMFDRVFERLSSLLGLDVYFHYVLQPNGKSVRLSSSGGLSPDVTRLYAKLQPGSSICAEVARSGRAVYIEHIDESDDPLTAHLRDLGIKAYVCHPIATADGVLGTLSFGTRQTPVIERETAAVLRTVCDHIATKMKRNLAERALRESEERFRSVAEAIPDILWTADAQLRWTYVNPRFEQYTGIPTDLAHGDGWKKAVHPDDRPSLERAEKQALASGGAYNVEKRMRRRDGEYRWFVARAVAGRDASGAVTHWYGTCSDIDDLKRAKEQNDLLVGELNHRVKNTLATVLSISDQTARAARTVEEHKSAFEGRMFALAHAHGLLSRTHWRGAKLRSLLEEVVAPFKRDDHGNLTLEGPDVTVTPRIATTLTLAVHELATNAAKYGALSTKMGNVRVFWQVDTGETSSMLRVEWRESGGPPVKAPQRRGFGSRLLQRSVSYELGGDVSLTFDPDGVRCVLQIPLQETLPVDEPS